jgi:hypothetical protein
MYIPSWFDEKWIDTDAKALGVYIALLYSIFIAVRSKYDKDLTIDWVKNEIARKLAGKDSFEASKSAESFLKFLYINESFEERISNVLENIEGKYYDKFRKACYKYFKRRYIERLEDEDKKDLVTILERLRLEPANRTAIGSMNMSFSEETEGILYHLITGTFDFYNLNPDERRKQSKRMRKLFEVLSNSGILWFDEIIPAPFLEEEFLEEEFKSFQILGVEAPKLFINEWGKIIVKIKGKGKVSINLEGNIEWNDLGTKEISGESIIEIPVKPKISGDVPVKVIIDSPYGKESSTILLKVEKKEVKPPESVVKGKVPEIGDIIPLRNMPLKNLVSGYGCSSTLFKVNLSTPIIPKEFVGAWNCCLLGCGGWGCAYLCIRGNEKIVIKVPRGFEAVIEGSIEAPTIHEILLKKIKSEAEIMGSLNHPNIIKFLGASSKFPLVIYEFADHGSLYWQLNKGWKPSLQEVILIGIQLGDAIRYIHSRGLIHGDIKPSNVFIKNGVAKLGDFSSTIKLLSSDSTSKMVTIGFRAPEQVFSDLRKKAKELDVENRIDIYQLGNLLLYILTGESIDGEDAEDEMLVMEKLSMIPNEELRSVLAEALKLEPDKRPSAEEFTKKLYDIWRKIAQ